MWTRTKHSLTLRIFLMTCGLMIAVCAATYGAIAYLTPLTYTSILQEELGQKTEALLTALSGREPSACDELLSAFCRETGAALRLSDEYGRPLYDTISSEAYLMEGTAGRVAITTEDGETLEQDAVMQATETEDATGTAESVIHQVTVTDAYLPADEARSFFFRDGTMGYLLVVDGKKAVNQASEAMKKTLPFLALLKAPARTPDAEPAPVVTAAPAPTETPAEEPASAPDPTLRYFSFASLCEVEVRFPVPEDIVSAEITFFDPNFPDEVITYPIPESSIESGKYHTMRETYSSVREAHPDFYADSAVESTLSVRVTITHADGRVETLAAERPAAQRFTIACGYDTEGDTVSVYLTPAEGGTIPDAIVGNDLSTLDADTVFVWPEVEGFDPSAASIEKNDYSCIVTLPLPEEHAELVTIHVYFLPDGETEPFDFAETVRTTPYKEAAS